MQNYVVYHLHSDLSSCVTSIDSITKPKQFIDKAKEYGMKAMAFSEHGSVMMWLKKKEMIEAAGMKYIHAEEFYITEILEEKIKDNMHCILIAKNYDGVLELNKLSSRAFNREDNHFYYMPRISLEELENTSDNILCTSACLASPLAKGSNNAKKRFLNFLIKNKDRCYLEIQHHAEDRQIKYNQYLYKLSQKYEIPLITGTDTHALNDEHMKARAILQQAKNIHFEDEDAWDLSFKSYNELIEAYQKQNSLPLDIIVEAIENTNRMADKIEEFSMDKSYKYPHLWENSEKVFIDKIKQGIKKRGVDKYPNRKEYAERIKYELKAYKHNQAIDFMLLMEDIISWCRTQNIQIGYGRGSVNGSVIAWILGITEMDSIKHGLNFERFMNIERVSLSDIDTDFPPSRIEDVKQYIFSRHGLYCSDIATFNTIADKGAIRDVGRALGLPLNEVNIICDSVDNEKNYNFNKKKYPELFKYVDMVKGVVVSCGNHPCGIITAPYSIDDRLGLFTTKTDSYPISQLYMKEVDSLNYVKLDCLKLDTIELIANTCKLANIPMITPDNMDIDDIAVWNSIRDDTTGIFQWEGDVGNSYIKQLMSDLSIQKFSERDSNFSRMTLMSIGNSAIRPAGASYREDLANGIIRDSGSSVLNDFLKPTFGYLVFQCQIIEFLHKYCGFTMGEADIVRRHFSKKIGTENDIPIIQNGGYLTNEKKHYIKGFIQTMNEIFNMPENEAKEVIKGFLKVIEDASSYLFSLNHSQPYSYEGYACGYLRYYYPLEFIITGLNIFQDNENKTLEYTRYAKKIGIKIQSVKFGKSRATYSCDKITNSIYKGMASIKFLNDKIADELYELGQNDYRLFIDLLVDIKEKTSVNSRQLEILVKLDFFSQFGEINKLLEQIRIFELIYDKKQFKIDKIKELRLPIESFEKCSKQKIEKIFKNFDSQELIKDICSKINYPETTIFQKIKYQQEHYGYIQITIPNINPSYAFVQKIDGKQSKKVNLYRLNDGSIETVKVRAKAYSNHPFNEGDIIKTIDCYDDKKWKYDSEDDSYYQIDETERILSKWSIVEDD